MGCLSCHSILCFMLLIAVSSSHKDLICKQPTVWFAPEINLDRICPLRVRDSNNLFTLKTSFSEWMGDVTQDQLLLNTFPLDPVSSNYVRQVRNALFSVVKPTPFKTAVKLAGVSDHAMNNILDLDVKVAYDRQFLEVFSGNSVLQNSVPLSHRYGGHQFGSWSAQLGDGRAHLLGEYVNQRGERWELQLKGSGRTPYSRHGDGRAVIRSSVREFLCSEAMFHLGIPTSRAVSLSVSNDLIWRDQFYDGRPIQERGAVVLRLAKSWFRIGSLEILTYSKETSLLQSLVDFVIENHFTEIDTTDRNKYLAFFSEVVTQTAHLIAQWMSFGFAHGVMNTDNMSLLSITIDYGPFGFLDAYRPSYVPNTSDDELRYSYENQPSVGHFNLNKMREALIPLLRDDQVPQMMTILNGYADLYERKYMEIFRSKLGLLDNNKNDEYLIALLLKMMEDTKADFTMTFRQLGDANILDPDYIVPESLWALKRLEKSSHYEKWVILYRKRLIESNIADNERKTRMHSINPRYILRNWIAQSVIDMVERDEFGSLQKVYNILKEPFKEQPEAEELGYAAPPPSWASQLKVSCSS